MFIKGVDLRLARLRILPRPPAPDVALEFRSVDMEDTYHAMARQALHIYIYICIYRLHGHTEKIEAGVAGETLSLKLLFDWCDHDQSGDRCSIVYRYEEFTRLAETRYVGMQVCRYAGM